MTRPDVIIDWALRRGMQIVTAESCTGGLLAGALTSVPGASAVLERGFITYSNAAKRDLLGVPAETLAHHGAVSEAVAAAMATGALQNSGAALAIGITGIAGPGGAEHKPEGRVCFGIADGRGARAETVEFGPLGRDKVRAAAVAHALTLLAGALT